MGMNHQVAPWCGDKKGLWGALGLGRRRPVGLDISGQSPVGQGRPCERLSRAGRGGSLLKNNPPCPSYSESSSTPGNGATPEEFPALADSPTTLTEALQMIHPIPADSWRNLIEQIGGCPRRRRGVTGGKRGLLVGSGEPCSWNAVAFHLGKTHLTRKVLNIFGSNGSMGKTAAGY